MGVNGANRGIGARTLGLAALLGLCGTASAQYSQDFEGLSGSSTGVSVVGQDGWTSSPTQPSSAHNVFTYAGNSLGLAANPTGGNQFLGGRCPDGTTFARAQHDLNWSAGDQWVISYDLCPNYDGALPAALNLASASDQRNDLAATRQFIALKNFLNVSDPVGGGWKSEYNVFDSGGLALNNQIAFTNLTTNHWYRESIHVDFSTNQITLVQMTDLTTNVTTDFVPPGWFLTGGANPINPLPDAFRFFVGGSAGNIMGWDNLAIEIESACPCACNYDTSTGQNVCDIFDFLEFQNDFAASDECACNTDTSTGQDVCDIFDFLGFQNNFAGGCP
jgi:hypothetical protein